MSPWKERASDPARVSSYCLSCYPPPLFGRVVYVFAETCLMAIRLSSCCMWEFVCIMNAYILNWRDSCWANRRLKEPLFVLITFASFWGFLHLTTLIRSLAHISSNVWSVVDTEKNFLNQVRFKADRWISILYFGFISTSFIEYLSIHYTNVAIVGNKMARSFTNFSWNLLLILIVSFEQAVWGPVISLKGDGSTTTPSWTRVLGCWLILDEQHNEEDDETNGFHLLDGSKFKRMIISNIITYNGRAFTRLRIENGEIQAICFIFMPACNKSFRDELFQSSIDGNEWLNDGREPVLLVNIFTLFIVTPKFNHQRSLLNSVVIAGFEILGITKYKIIWNFYNRDRRRLNNFSFFFVVTWNWISRLLANKVDQIGSPGVARSSSTAKNWSNSVPLNCSCCFGPISSSPARI